MKGWFRSELLTDDRAIERIWRSQCHKARTLSRDAPAAERKVIAAALSYIRTRKNKMRYASLHAEKLAIGSGATESTRGLMCRWLARSASGWC